METNYLAHYGIKGQKWGVRRFQNKDGSYTAAGKKRYDKAEYSNKSPKIQLSNGDFLYKKGTVVGRYGKQDLDNSPMYLYTNKKDRDKYEDYIGGEEQKFIVKKPIKIPNEVDQLYELYKYTKDPDVINNTYDYWKDHINQGGPIADGYFKHMKELGYDGLIDSRNSGYIADDPILLLDPVSYLKEL